MQAGFEAKPRRMARLEQGHHIPVKVNRVAAVMRRLFRKKPDSMMAEPRRLRDLRRLRAPRETVIAAMPQGHWRSLPN